MFELIKTEQIHILSCDNPTITKNFSWSIPSNLPKKTSPFDKEIRNKSLVMFLSKKKPEPINLQNWKVMIVLLNTRYNHFLRPLRELYFHNQSLCSE